jgi:hypothetical protein
VRRAYINLQFAPHWELIDPAREFLLSFFTHTLARPMVASQISMAAHELMENAVKYSPTDEARIRIEVDSTGPVQLIVENEALEEHIPILLAEVQAATEAKDPFVFYRQKMELALTRSDGKSCLGLARIRCEGQMSLRCEIEGNIVRMIAVRTLDPDQLSHPVLAPLSR